MTSSTRPSRSGRVALAVSVLALAASATGGAYAAGRITGSDIKDRTLGPGDLLVRAARASSNDDAIAGVNGTVPALTATVKAPTDGLLVVSAGSDVFDVSGGTVTSTCWVEVDGDELLDSERTLQLSAQNSEEDCSTGTTVPVRRGTHTVTLTASVQDTTTYDESSLSAVFVPFNGKGQRPSVPLSSRTAPRVAVGN